MKREVQRVYAVIQTGGKQYRVQQGDVIYVEKLAAAQDSLVNFDVLLLGKDDGLVVGTPLVESAKVTGKVLGDVKSAKVIFYKFRSKKNSRRKQGHRQPYTKVEVTQVG
jgi:large subunit ribosomal protein L21